MNEFEKLLHENIKQLERYVNYKVSNKHDAEDLIQDICLNATVNFETLRNPSAFKPWLIGIANHKINDYYRLKAKILEIPIETVPESSLGVSKIGFCERSTVGETLDRLADKEKQILYLYFFKDLSQETIAQKLALPIGTVKSRLYYAKQKFKQNYPHLDTSKGDNIMKKFPNFLPEYKIEYVDAPVFPVIFEELPNWFIVPRFGDEIKWASYDLPSRNLTEIVHSKAVAPAFIHGVEGVEVLTEFEDHGNDFPEYSPHIYYAQLTDSHCRWLGESYTDENGAKHLLTFLDGDEFIAEWGYGDDNCGRETHLSAHGIITRDGSDVSVNSSKHVIDVVGRYNIYINNKKYDTIGTIEYCENGVITEQYIDRNGHTVLWRRFNKNDWANKRYGKLWTEMFPDNERITVNGEIYVHWYDCITDYIL
ncbi:MAG: RNA polymerase sigma factor [Clostridia bacterium]|nr:RNA polymerase sigma factor [Clostridia bacterium]